MTSTWAATFDARSEDILEDPAKSRLALRSNAHNVGKVFLGIAIAACIGIIDLSPST
jgi:hypothetical protein